MTLPASFRPALRPAALAVGLALLAGFGAASPASAEEPAAKPAEAEGYGMLDVGATLVLPKGWEMTKWADWEFKAKTADGVLLRLYLTPYQADINAENANAWAKMYETRLTDEGGSKYSGQKAEVGTATLAGGESAAAARSSLAFSFEKQRMDGVLHAAAIQGSGQVIHIETISAARNDTKAKEGLDAILAGLTLDKKPLPTEGPRVSSAKAEFAFTAPEGWRAPLGPELEAVLKVTDKLGEDELEADRCATAIRAPATGDPDVMFACAMPKYLDPVDEYSFEGIEKELHELFFSKASTPVAPAEKVQAGDRLGFFYKPPVAGKTVRMALAPYNHGMVMLSAIAGSLDEAALDAAARSAVTSIEYTAVGGGSPIIAIDRRFMHYLRYRPTSPVVIGPAVVLVLLVGGVFAYMRADKARRMRAADL